MNASEVPAHWQFNISWSTVLRSLIYEAVFSMSETWKISSIQLHLHQSYCTLELLYFFSWCDLTSWERFSRISFQRPSFHPRCCFVDILASSTSSPCIHTADVCQTVLDPQGDVSYAQYVFSPWRNGSEIFRWTQFYMTVFYRHALTWSCLNGWYVP